MSSKEKTHVNDKDGVKRRPPQSNAQDLEQTLQSCSPTPAVQRAKAVPQSLTSRDILQFQQTLGNQAVGGLLNQRAKHPAIQKKASTDLESLNNNPKQGEQFLDASLHRSIGRQGMGNPNGAIAALNGLAVLPTDMRSAQSDAVVERLANALLDARYDFEGEHKRWLTFGVPRAWDLLSALKALAAHGYARDSRFVPLLELTLGRQDAQGGWTCGSVSRTWPMEKRNQPSKWITLDALRVLKQECTGIL